MSSSAKPRRSARIAAQKAAKSAPAFVPNPIGYYKVHFAKQPRDSDVVRVERWAQGHTESDQEAASRRIDARIKTALDDLVFWESIGEEIEYLKTLRYLFENLIDSVHYRKLNPEHNDALFAVVETIHLYDNKYGIRTLYNYHFVSNYNKLCDLLSEVGYPRFKIFL